MADIPINFPSYAIQYSEPAKESRKQLPPEVMLALYDVIDELAENPDAFPSCTSPISRDGRTHVYTQEKPPLQTTYEVDKEAHLLYLLHFVAPQVPVPKKVFISYSHKDVAWLEKLKMFLHPLEDQRLVKVWDDTNIPPARSGSKRFSSHSSGPKWAYS